MSPKLKRLSGRTVISILGKFGFIIHSQKGDHVKLRRISSTGERQTLTVPFNNPMGNFKCFRLKRASLFTKCLNLS